MTHVSRRRHAAGLVFAATCGFLAGVVVAAVLLILFRAGDAVPSAQPSSSEATPTASGPPAPVADASPAIRATPEPPAGAAAGDVPDAPDPPRIRSDTDAAIADLRRRRLDVPVRGVERDALRSSFDETRGGSRRHEAMDILAPRGTPVMAVEDGTVARLFTSVAGGLTVYQFDPTTSYAYYYAHLDGYADGLAEGAAVARGQILGYVGTTGNAPKDTPHLHFGIFVLGVEKRWWEGTAIDPFEVFR